jgi:hypothetical protein
MNARTHAGIFFDLSGAVASHAFCADLASAVTPLALLAIAAASWALRSPTRTLPDRTAA